MTELLVSLEEIQSLRAYFGDKASSERERQALGRIRQQIATSQREYLWAFANLADALQWIQMRHREWFRPYPHPDTMEEYALQSLYEHFPFGAATHRHADDDSSH